MITNRVYRRIAPAALAATLALGIAACSSGGSSSAGSGGSAKSASSTSGPAKAAAQAVAALTQRPTTLSIGPKVTKPIPTGKVLATINCGTDACTNMDGIIKTAAATLGWTTLEIQTDGTAQQINNAWQEAIQKHVSGIVDVGTSRSQVETYIQQAKAAGIAVVIDSTTDSAGNGVLASIQSGATTGVQGTDLGAWVANDAYKSGNPDASILFVNVPDFQVLSSTASNWATSIKKYCPDCKVQDLNIGLSSLQQATSTIESKLRSDPSIKYVVSTVQNVFDSVPPALKAAGINVKVVGAVPSNVTLTQLRSGEVTAVTAFAAYEQSYAILDVFVRYYAGVISTAPPAPYKFESWVLTKANAPSTNLFPIVANLAQQYETAWGK